MVVCIYCRCHPSRIVLREALWLPLPCMLVSFSRISPFESYSFFIPVIIRPVAATCCLTIHSDSFKLQVYLKKGFKLFGNCSIIPFG